MRRLAATILLAALPACSAVAEPARPAPQLAPYFDCLRERGEAVVSAHRAGPGAGLPENALETIRATLDADPNAIVELDVRRSADGVLFLLHDERLERTTTGRGTAAELRWRALSRLRLKDDEGAVTRSRIPSLSDALELVRARGAIATLDVKRGVPFADVIAAVRAGRAERHATIITYNVEDAAEVSRLAPDLMISVDAPSREALDRHRAAGVPVEQMLAFTGTREPRLRWIAALEEEGIEPIVGTLGRPGSRIDDRWLADGDASEYVELARQGAVIIATDAPRAVAEVLPDPTCRVSPSRDNRR
ncbi:MAG: glycerophosphodiester phosphodiesterase family protein [Sphingopyxis sp.]|nr:glycerophosphodiester phosphodiesterase family protein [Sphingopyxis sp.]